MTYESMFRNIDSAEVVLVSGEQDNVYVPGFGEDLGGDGPVENWDGLFEGGKEAKDQEQRYATPVLGSGRYIFELTGNGDADLYVRVGDEPSAEIFDCRPFLNGTNESCTVQLSTPARIHVMVPGWNASSEYKLEGK